MVELSGSFYAPETQVRILPLKGSVYVTTLPVGPGSQIMKDREVASSVFLTRELLGSEAWHRRMSIVVTVTSPQCGPGNSVRDWESACFGPEPNKGPVSHSEPGRRVAGSFGQKSECVNKIS